MKSTRLNDTEALVRQGLRPAHFRTSDESYHPASGTADQAVSGSGLAVTGQTRFRKEVRAGSESLPEACGHIDGEC